MFYYNVLQSCMYLLQPPTLAITLLAALQSTQGSSSVNTSGSQ